MKLFLVWQNQNNNYDTYDSMVVAAENEDEARNMHPRYGTMNPEEWGMSGSWCDSPDKANVQYLGEAVDDPEIVGVICSSFNAG